VGEAEPEVAELEARVVQALVRLVQAARARAPLVPRQEEVLVQATGQPYNPSNPNDPRNPNSANNPVSNPRPPGTR
jgi:hypothetical protein